MADLVEILGLQGLLASAHLELNGGDFEALYDRLVSSANGTDSAAQIEQKVRGYFAALELPERATAYDSLLLSLRPKDLVATFNWDPLLAQAFRRHEGRISMPQLAFLHGNTAIGYCAGHRRCGWHDDVCETCGKAFAPSPLLFPVRNKDYSANPFIANEWAVLRMNLARAYFVTIFGYSAPVTDMAARELMVDVWSKNEAREIAEVEIIDVKPRRELHQTWGAFITRQHWLTARSISRSSLSWHPRRSCEALYAATMLNKPWGDDWLPRFSSYARLREWLDPLYREEVELRGSDTPLSGCPCKECHDRR